MTYPTCAFPETKCVKASREGALPSRARLNNNSSPYVFHSIAYNFSRYISDMQVEGDYRRWMDEKIIHDIQFFSGRQYYPTTGSHTLLVLPKSKHHPKLPSISTYSTAPPFTSCLSSCLLSHLSLIFSLALQVLLGLMSHSSTNQSFHFHCVSDNMYR